MQRIGTKRLVGFTLIEVLIALMIIAIALAAAIRSVHQSIRVTDKVKTDMVAHWVAMNALSEIQLGMVRVPEMGDPVVGRAKMIGLIWDWKATVVSAQNDMAYANQIKIIVQLNKKQVTSLYGFVGKDAA